MFWWRKWNPEKFLILSGSCRNLTHTFWAAAGFQVFRFQVWCLLDCGPSPCCIAFTLISDSGLEGEMHSPRFLLFPITLCISVYQLGCHWRFWVYSRGWVMLGGKWWDVHHFGVILIRSKSKSLHGSFQDDRSIGTTNKQASMCFHWREAEICILAPLVTPSELKWAPLFTNFSEVSCSKTCTEQGWYMSFLSLQ